MEKQKIERVDEIPLILNWLTKMRTAEMIDAVWYSHGNWQGLSYGQSAVLFITYVVYTLNHRLSGMEDWVMKHKIILEKITGRTDFIYVADSKAGALETRAVIDREGGDYLSPLPMTGKVPEILKNLVSEPPPALE